jgi:hypothetical protein
MEDTVPPFGFMYPIRTAVVVVVTADLVKTTGEELLGGLVTGAVGLEQLTIPIVIGINNMKNIFFILFLSYNIHYRNSIYKTNLFVPRLVR